MTNQSDRQADVRASTGTLLTYEGDYLALFDQASIPAGDFNGRFLKWINQRLGTSFTEINGAKTALAVSAGAPTWDGLGAGAIAAFTTFDPATKTAGAALSNNNLTITNNNLGTGTAYSVSAKTAGLFVIQWTITNKVDANLAMGLGIRPIGGFPGQNADSIGCFADGTCYNNSFSAQAALGAFVNGDIGTMAVNLGTKLAWFKKNSGLWNANASANPDTGVGGFAFSTLMTGSLYLAGSTGANLSALTLNPNPTGTGLTTFSGWGA